MTYNDKAVLENFHASAIFRILKDENYNILANLKKEEYRFVEKKTRESLLFKTKLEYMIYTASQRDLCTLLKSFAFLRIVGN